MPPVPVFSHQTVAPMAAWKEAVQQVAQNLHRCQSDPATARVLADYFLRAQPEIAGNLPFGVALAHATILYHLKLHRPSTADLENIVALLNTVVALASDGEIACDPAGGPGAFFFEEVVRGALLGLGPRSRHVRRRSAQLLTPVPHLVATLPAALYDSFAFIACSVTCGSLRLGALREEWLAAVEPLATAPAVLVSLRARSLQMRCGPLSAREHAAEVVKAVARNSEALPCENVALIFDHLRLAVSAGEAERTVEEHALCIAASVQLLELQSPVRRRYVEGYLYPALREPRMEQMLAARTDTAAQMGKQLLRLMSGTQQAAACPFYLSACALFQRMLRADSPLRGALFLVSLCQLVMPEGGAFVASLAVDAQMDPEYFAQVVFEIVGALNEAIDFTNRFSEEGEDEDDDDANSNNSAGGRSAAQRKLSPVAELIDRGGVSLFVKVLFMLRLIVSSVVSTSSAAFGPADGGSSAATSAPGSGRSSLASGGLRSRHGGGTQPAADPQQRPDNLVYDLRQALSRDMIHKIGNFVETVVIPCSGGERHERGAAAAGGAGGRALQALGANGVADVCPRVLVVEIAMLLHQEFVDETIGRVREFLTEQLASKTSDANTNLAIVASMNRVLLALADSPTARDRFAAVHCAGNWLRHDPLDPVTHVLIFNVLARCPTPTARLELFDALCPSIIASVLPAVRRNLVGGAVAGVGANNNGGGAAGSHGTEDCAGASSALVLVTRMMLMVRPTGVASASSDDGAGNRKQTAAQQRNQQQQLVFKRLCNDVAMIASALAASNQMALKNHVALVLWWASLSLLRFGGEKTSVAVSSTGGNDASSGCYHLFTALRYVHLTFPKLVGIATARLVMDFCLHAPIIVDNLISVLDENPQQFNQQQLVNARRNRSKKQQRRGGDAGEEDFGNDDSAASSVERGGESLVERYSLALREDSPFRTWLRKHIVRSVPSRTALLIAFAQCIASRVRVAQNPHELLLLPQQQQRQSTASVLVRERAFSAMLTDAVLATDRQACEAFCKSAVAWLRGDACPRMTTPGPFLMVVCALLSLRDAARAVRAKTRIDEALVREAPRVQTVAETLRHESPPFARFAFTIVSACTQQGGNDAAVNNMPMDHSFGSNDNISGGGAFVDSYRQQQQEGRLSSNQLYMQQEQQNGGEDDEDSGHGFDNDDGLIDNDDNDFQQQQQEQQHHVSNASITVGGNNTSTGIMFGNNSGEFAGRHQSFKDAGVNTTSSGNNNNASTFSQNKTRTTGSTSRSGAAAAAAAAASGLDDEDDARSFHIDTWQALQRQPANSLLLEVRNMMAGDFGPRVGGPAASAEDAAQQQLEQMAQVQRLMLNMDNGGPAGAGAASCAPFQPHQLEPSLTPNGSAVNWQQQQSYRTALREVQGMLVNHHNTGHRHGRGFNLDLI